MRRDFFGWGLGLAYGLKRTATLVGMMGSGKTAVGGALARMLDVPFLDSDEEIVREVGMPVAEIFDRQGEPFFRRQETLAIARLLEGPPGILSIGGGAFLSDENRRLISEAGVSVWLRAEVDLLWSRVRRKDTRPLLRAEDPYRRLKELCAERERYYAMADLAVDARAHYEIEDMAGKVLDALLERSGAVEKA